MFSRKAAMLLLLAVQFLAMTAGLAYAPPFRPYRPAYKPPAYKPPTYTYKPPVYERPSYIGGSVGASGGYLGVTGTKTGSYLGEYGGGYLGVTGSKHSTILGEYGGGYLGSAGTKSGTILGEYGGGIGSPASQETLAKLIADSIRQREESTRSRYVRPMPVKRSPESLRQEIDRLVGYGSSVTALQRLQNAEFSEQLTKTQREEIGRDVVKTTAERLKGVEARFALREADALKSEFLLLASGTKDFDSEAKAPDDLVSLVRGLELKVLEEGLQKTRMALARGRWDEVIVQADHWAGLPGDRAKESHRWSKTLVASAEGAREAYTRACDLAVRLQAHNRAAEALKAIDPKKLADTVPPDAIKKGSTPDVPGGFIGLPVDFEEGSPVPLAQGGKQGPSILPTDSLPPEVAKRVAGLRGLAKLETVRAGKTKDLKAADVLEAIANFERGAEGLGVDQSIGKRARQELAVRALLEGHGELADHLLDPNGSPEQAAALLCDLKVLATGGGTVSTPAGIDALPVSKPGESPAAPRPPPGLEPLIPEGARDGWRPPVREAASADLPPLHEEAATAMRQAAEKDLGAATQKLKSMSADVRDKVAAATNGLGAEERTLGNVEAVLNRPLKSEERALVRGLIQKKQDTNQIVNQIKRDEDEFDEDEAFLAAVADQLGRPLTATERSTARAGKANGKSVAEVVQALRQVPLLPRRI